MEGVHFASQSTDCCVVTVSPISCVDMLLLLGGGGGLETHFPSRTFACL